MSTWFISNLGDAMLADAFLDRIKVFFLSELGKANGPADMAVFVRHESEGRLHCELKVYLSLGLGENASTLPATCAV